MATILLFAIILSIILYHVFAIYYQKKLIKFILKPGTMALIILLAISGSGLESMFSKWVIIALLFSVLGDIFLMLEDKWFVHGLTSFLIAQLLYISGLWGQFSFDANSALLSGTILFIIALSFFLLLFPSVKKEGGFALSFAVAVYILVITIMVWFAVLSGVMILIIAAVLFYISDAVLALDKFKTQFTIAEHMVMITYFSAQLLFAWSICS